jgi:acyl-CoA hydrolase
LSILHGSFDSAGNDLDCCADGVACLVIVRCANPDYKSALLDYPSRAERLSSGKHTPHLLTKSLGWHSRYLRSGSMRQREEN